MTPTRQSISPVESPPAQSERHGETSKPLWLILSVASERFDKAGTSLARINDDHSRTSLLSSSDPSATTPTI